MKLKRERRRGLVDRGSFSVFIHWGLCTYHHEWVMSKEQISKTDYEKYVDYFDPDLYDPNEWAKLAKAAGMKYVVFG